MVENQSLQIATEFEIKNESPKFEITMEQIGHISIIISGKTTDGNLNPKDIDIDETMPWFVAHETFLYQ